MTTTLESIEAKQSELAEMIAKFKADLRVPLTLPSITINLNPGEEYAGLILGRDGAPNHHVILLPGEIIDSAWDAAKKWAVKQGGELPTRREQSLLYANMKPLFAEACYWSSERHESNDAFAWYQYFSYGGQYHGHKGGALRARAVRRLVIE